MEEITISYDLLCKALITLQESFDVTKKAQKLDDASLLLATQDSTIQRFEYSYDSFWKFVKRYLEKFLDIQENINSPKSVFRTMIKLNLCSPQEGEILLAMADDRNITSHNYSIEEVRKILPNIPNYYTCMKKILVQLEQKIDRKS